MEELGSTHPLLAKMAVKRGDVPEIPGYYSPALGVWVVETPTGPAPLISEAQKVLATLDGGPITKVQGERDKIGMLALLESSTKTLAQLERDDQSPQDLLHGLQTKTEVIQERNDAFPPYLACLMELATKTDTKRERDDR